MNILKWIKKIRVRSELLVSAVIFYLMSVLAACGLSPVTMPTINRYALVKTAEFRTQLNHTFYSSPHTLVVNTPIAIPPYNSDNLIYVDQTYQYQSFAKNRWIAPPAKMLLPLIADTIRSRNYFRAVVLAPFSGEATYRLDTKLIELKQDFTQQPSRAVVTLQFDLIEKQTNKIVISRQLSGHRIALADTPYGGVMAENELLRSLLNQMAEIVVVFSH